MPEAQKLLPKLVSDVLAAFPANVVGEYLPQWDDIPAEWKQPNKWENLAHALFYTGAPNGHIVIKAGIDSKMAGRHIMACLQSHEPRHEHKMAGVCYLMSLWFADWMPEEKEETDAKAP